MDDELKNRVIETGKKTGNTILYGFFGFLLTWIGPILILGLGELILYLFGDYIPAYESLDLLGGIVGLFIIIFLIASAFIEPFVIDKLLRAKTAYSFGNVVSVYVFNMVVVIGLNMFLLILSLILGALTFGFGIVTAVFPLLFMLIGGVYSTVIFVIMIIIRKVRK